MANKNQRRIRVLAHKFSRTGNVYSYSQGSHLPFFNYLGREIAVRHRPRRRHKAKVAFKPQYVKS